MDPSQLDGAHARRATGSCRFRLPSTLAIVDAATGSLTCAGVGAGACCRTSTTRPGSTTATSVFDNGCHRAEQPSFSQVLEVDPASKEIVWTFKAEPILAFYSFMVSGCDRLPNGNTFITEGATG